MLPEFRSTKHRPHVSTGTKKRASWLKPGSQPLPEMPLNVKGEGGRNAASSLSLCLTLPTPPTGSTYQVFWKNRLTALALLSKIEKARYETKRQ